MASPDPESVSWLRILLAFTVVFGLLALLGLALKQIGTRGFRVPGLSPRRGRLQIVESLTLDVRRRLVIIECDGNQHLLLLGANNDIVVESHLTKTPPPPSQITTAA